MSRHSCQSEAMRNHGMYVTCLFCCCVFFLGGFVQSANCCVVGYYGDTCRFPCPAKCKDGCRRSDGYCTNCTEGRFGNMCDKNCNSNCGASRAGTKPCDKSTGKCILDCVVGYYGDTCSYRCPEQCTDGCGRTNGICINCTEVKYGPNCNLWCDYQCRNGCHRTTGDCISCDVNYTPPTCTECVQGMYGTTCSEKCSSHCRNGCDKRTGACNSCYGNYALPSCTACKDGWYGTICDETCSANCASYNPLLSAGRCDRDTGYCSNGCTNGWYGTSCNMQCLGTCNERGCNQSTGMCITCASNFAPPECNNCIQGTYGTTCQSRCSDSCRNGCHKTTGDCNSCVANFALPKCSECVQGRHGTTCQWRCSDNCQNGCNKNTGNCNSCVANFALPNCTGCTRGFYGTLCDMRCQGTCGTTGCNQSTGKCFTCAENFAPPECNSCLSGWEGAMCNDKVCSDHCVPGNYICNRRDGYCYQGCQDGWFGDTCDQECSSKCAASSAPLSGKRCYRQNGYCSNGCQDGWYGNKCDQECSSKCAASSAPLSGKRCYRQNGYCSNGCLPGWEGQFCNQKICSDHCTLLYTSYICDRANGHCIYGCQDGWYGTTCEDACSSNCAFSSSPLGMPKRCDTVDGMCSNGCIDGWYGSFCNMTCRGSCSAGCNQRTGHCTSCKGNFTMPECTECIQGFYGVNCTEVCGSCIHNETCSPITGLCAKGCTEGFTGNDCKLSLASDTQSATAGIVGGVIAALAVIIAVLIIVIMYRRRRRQRKNEPTEEKSGNSEPFYNNILTQEMHPGSDSTSLHVYGNISSSSSHGLQPRKMPRKNISVTNDTYSHSADKCNAGVDIHKYENVGAVASAGQPLVLKPSHDVRVSSASAKDIKTDAEDDVFEDSYDDIYNSEDIYSAYKPDNPSPQLDTLQRSLLASLASGGLSTQFELLPKGMFSSHKEGVKPANIKKNRFKALCAYDHSRVILHRPAGDPDTDYINANYIKGYKKDKAYIAAQGPRSSTVNDMWWMIWQEGITQIVMLTNLTEDGKNKCDEYWPKAGTPCTYGHVEVTNVDEEQRADFIKRSFSIKEKGTTDKRQLEQYHYVAWPDHGVPPATSLVNFWRYIKARANPNAPPLVHCSAGVGRTGTYIALDIAMDIAVDKGDVDVHNIVNNLRKDRCIMVQAEAQYKFLHEVILEAYTSHKTRLTFKRFHELFPDEINIHKSNKIIDNEYKMLQQMGEFHPKSIHDVSSSKENMKKNRNANVLPDDNHLAYLAAEGSGGNTYINATYLSSFKQRKGVILTQLPFPDTLQDFWRLVDGKEINTIVSLGSNNDVTSIKNFCQYLPKTVNESLTIGPYVINLMSSASIGSNLTSYNLSIWTEKKTWEVRLLHYTNWVGEVPDNIGEIIHLVDTLSTSRDQTDSCPLLFQCIDGASRSGLFSLSCDIVNRAVFDREIDIFQSARQVQSVRPQAVSKEVQYRYCYKLAQDYQRHMEVYQNT